MSRRIERADGHRASRPARSFPRARRAAWFCVASLPLLGWLARALGEIVLGDVLALAALAIASGLLFARPSALIGLVVAAAVAGPTVASLVPPIYWPPIAWNFATSACFFASLARDESLVETFARLCGEAPDAALRDYCRRVTLVWALWLALLGVVGIGVALAGNERLGAWWAGVIDYALIAAPFVGEYLWRRRRGAAPRDLVGQIMAVRKGLGVARND
jgi:uncharacterized membrane protein